MTWQSAYTLHDISPKPLTARLSSIEYKECWLAKMVTVISHYHRNPEMELALCSIYTLYHSLQIYQERNTKNFVSKCKTEKSHFRQCLDRVLTLFLCIYPMPISLEYKECWLANAETILSHFHRWLDKVLTLYMISALCDSLQVYQTWI